MEIGKISNEMLDSLILGRLKRHDARILTSAGIGEDCGVIDFGENVCIVSSDPVTGASKRIGSIAVHVACNDIAASGVRPLAIVVTLLIPPDSSPADLETVIDDIVNTADAIKVSVIGGHTEVTDAVTRVVVSVTAIGIAGHGGYVSAKNAKAGDTVLMTKKAGLEGTAIIAFELEDELKSVLYGDEIDEAKAFSGMVSVIEEGVAAHAAGAHAMHDITEGGVFGAAWEIAEAAGLGIEIYKENIPVADVTLKICEHYDVDPYRLISSGSMMIVTDAPEKVRKKLEESGVECTVIGKMTGDPAKRYIKIHNKKSEKIEKLVSPEPDELYKVFNI